MAASSAPDELVDSSAGSGYRSSVPFCSLVVGLVLITLPFESRNAFLRMSSSTSRWSSLAACLNVITLGHEKMAVHPSCGSDSQPDDCPLSVSLLLSCDDWSSSVSLLFACSSSSELPLSELPSPELPLSELPLSLVSSLSDDDAVSLPLSPAVVLLSSLDSSDDDEERFSCLVPRVSSICFKVSLASLRVSDLSAYMFSCSFDMSSWKITLVLIFTYGRCLRRSS